MALSEIFIFLNDARMKETRNSKNPKRKPFGDPSRNKCLKNLIWRQSQQILSQFFFLLNINSDCIYAAFMSR